MAANGALISGVLNLAKAKGFPPGAVSRRRNNQRHALIDGVWWIYAVQMRQRTQTGDPDHGRFVVELASFTAAEIASDAWLTGLGPSYAAAPLRMRLERSTAVRDADWWRAEDLESGAIEAALLAQGLPWLERFATPEAHLAAYETPPCRGRYRTAADVLRAALGV